MGDSAPADRYIYAIRVDERGKAPNDTQQARFDLFKRDGSVELSTNLGGAQW